LIGGENDENGELRVFFHVGENRDYNHFRHFFATMARVAKKCSPFITWRKSKFFDYWRPVAELFEVVEDYDL
jgi:hypothetical protein